MSQSRREFETQFQTATLTSPSALSITGAPVMRESSLEVGSHRFMTETIWRVSERL